MSLPSPNAASPSVANPRAVPLGGLRHLLVCLDRSGLGASCLPHAFTLARVFGSRLTLLHVVPAPVTATPEAGISDALEWEVSRREAEHYLRSVRGASPPGIGEPMEISVSQGRPAERIVATAREIGADLIVLSSCGDGTADNSHLGSTAHRVLDLAPGSVMVVRPDSMAAVPFRRVLVPLDGSSRAEYVLPAVVELARSESIEVALVHAVSEPTPSALLSDPADVELARGLAERTALNAARYLAQVRERALREVPSVRTIVVQHGDERMAVLEAAGQYQADLIVVTAHGRTCNTERAFGTLASHLLARSTTPVLVLQDVPANECGHLRAEETRRTRSGVRPAERH